MAATSSRLVVPAGVRGSAAGSGARAHLCRSTRATVSRAGARARGSASTGFRPPSDSLGRRASCRSGRRRPASAARTAQASRSTSSIEDDALIVIDKPAGLVVIPAAELERHAAERAARARAGARGHAARRHRPPPRQGHERAPRGRENAGGANRLVRQPQARSVSREYAALAHGRIERTARRGADRPPPRQPHAHGRVARRQTGGHAFRRRRALRRRHAAPCRLETGRTHQIRVHLARSGIRSRRPGLRPAPGDGTRRVSRQALHAESSH